jgi:hypothetical protein
MSSVIMELKLLTADSAVRTATPASEKIERKLKDSSQTPRNCGSHLAGINCYALLQYFKT